MRKLEAHMSLNRRDLLIGGSSLAVAGLAFGHPATAVEAHAPSQRESLLLDSGWRFHEGDVPFPAILSQDDSYDNAKAGKAWGAAAPTFDDSEWPIVRLPHDFVSFQPIEEHYNRAQGYRKRGIAWYRNVLRFEPDDTAKHIELQIEGVATHATVWYNGNVIAHNWSGYNSLYIDLTPFTTYGSELNTLAIRVDAESMEGWWYEGGGLYRTVRIVKRHPVHIVTDGVLAHPVKLASGWTLPVEVTLYSTAKSNRVVSVKVSLKDKEGTVIDTETLSVTVTALDQRLARLNLTHDSPELWSVDCPTLYTVETCVMDGDLCVDGLVTTCGFRTTRFDAKTGFYLNDKPLKIQGVCIHQDHAGVGTAIPDALWDYRIRRLKELGCNAVRCTHNAPSSIVLDLCDRYGLLVMDENRLFNPSPEYIDHVRWMVRRDRNHPSIILWSVFNEEPMQGSAAGYEMVRRMAHEVKLLDTSRPVTAAMNSGMFSAINVSQAVDVVGFNYQQDKYDAFHKAHPDIALTSSEDTSNYSVRGAYVTDQDKRLTSGYDDPPKGWATHRGSWKMIAERDFIAGGFVWTGFDYHGEPSPWGWPTNSSMYGIMDLCGFEKDAFYIHQAQWIKTQPVLHIVPHWNWEGREGQPIKVMACANSDDVELFLNGHSLGRQVVDKYEMNFWQVPYAPGRLEALAYKAGKVIARASVETTGVAVGLKITPDRETAKGDGLDAVAFRIEAVDARGRTLPTAQNTVHFSVTNGDIIGLGNGDPNSAAPEKGNQRALFNGLAQVIVQTQTRAGDLILMAQAEGLKTATARVKIEPTQAPSRQATTTSVQVLDYWYDAPPEITREDALKNRLVNMTLWHDFGPRELQAGQTRDGYTLVSARYTPFAKVQAEGGSLDFPRLTGAVEVYDGTKLIGTKTDPAEGFLSVALPPGKGERRVNLLFRTLADTPYAFQQNVIVRQRFQAF
ncbi:beta-galactosidase GalA [Asticcacaulis benevestitus]|uniref:beta-galactosidase GalA n=2 Tax=Asticcacaulis benevestitus TaxID=347481 RepID=UPI001F3B8D96|nr:beta-galactosidase GalA [Asticcacaulis benevestitus]